MNAIAPTIGKGRPDAYEAATPGFYWPLPDELKYAEAVSAPGPLDCVIKGLNGTRMVGKLVGFVPQARAAYITAPQSRTLLKLGFDQFQSLSLPTPLKRLRSAPRRVKAYSVTLANGEIARGETVGHVETPEGLFLYPTSDSADAGGPDVYRIFLPRSAYGSWEVDEQGRTVFDDEPSTNFMQFVDQSDADGPAQTDILAMNMVKSTQQLRDALRRQHAMEAMRIGEALVSLGFVTEIELETALQRQRIERGVPLGKMMVTMGAVSEEELRIALAHKMGYPIVQLESFPIEMAAVLRLPLAQAMRLQVMPIAIFDQTLVIAMDDPAGRRSAIDETEFIAQIKVAAVLAQSDSFAGAQWDAYQRFGKATEPAPKIEGARKSAVSTANSTKLIEQIVSQNLASDDGSDDDMALQVVKENDNPLVRLVNSIIIEAHDTGASDIHIENELGKKESRIRFRRDGRMQPHLKVPAVIRNELVSRIKIMCDLDTTERRNPQDGKIKFARYSPAHQIELRVSAIPTNGGSEDMVLRVLASAKPTAIDKLGLSAANLAALRASIERPYGLVLCVGPTGSGKTTTLHSALGHINTPDRKIWTAEDPIEITQEGLRQVQVNPKAGFTFAKALRAFLRADPDVVMVGEIRDEETARIAIEASLTGHLVMSTLHTNSAPETVVRLLDMGLDPFNFADSLLAVVAQRLVKRLCADCKTSRPATNEEIDELLKDHIRSFGPAVERPPVETVLARWQGNAKGGRLHLYEPRGCKACEMTGFKGRAALHEVMQVSRELRRQIQTSSPSETLQSVALNEGMQTLRQDGIEKVWAGIATIADVRAITNN